MYAFLGDRPSLSHEPGSVLNIAQCKGLLNKPNHLSIPMKFYLCSELDENFTYQKLNITN